jgi:hypothetical protein
MSYLSIFCGTVIVQGFIHPSRSFQVSSELELEVDQLSVEAGAELSMQFPISSQTTGYADIGIEHLFNENTSELHSSVAVSQGTSLPITPYLGISAHVERIANSN